MFDYVTEVPPLKCRKCGALLKSWQSKDGHCRLHEIPYWTVSNFYCLCDGLVEGKRCCEWHEYTRRVPPHYAPISDYDLRDPE